MTFIILLFLVCTKITLWISQSFLQTSPKCQEALQQLLSNLRISIVYFSNNNDFRFLETYPFDIPSWQKEPMIPFPITLWQFKCVAVRNILRNVPIIRTTPGNTPGSKNLQKGSNSTMNIVLSPPPQRCLFHIFLFSFSKLISV